MLFNQFAEGRFSAIAASFNPEFERGTVKARAPRLYVGAEVKLSVENWIVNE